IGIFEANAIALELEKIATPRPMTHDLIINVMAGLKARIQKIVISELKDNTYFANIHLDQNKVTVIIDARPSDAIAIALRADAPIFVSKDVVERTQSFDIDFKLDTSEKMKDWLESLEPEDFGKYKM
ncbi:bifunctional nuclease family protein, partial [bacterium]|nr:bifunctional nuclease family protein [bacterium]